LLLLIRDPIYILSPFESVLEWGCNQCKVLDVCSEEVAQPYEGSDGFDVCGWFGILDNLMLVLA